MFRLIFIAVFACKCDFWLFSISICTQLIIKRFVYFRIFLFEERKSSSILAFLLLGTGYYYFCLMFVYGGGVAGKGNLYFLKNTASENEMLSLPSLSTVGLIHPNFFQLFFRPHTEESTLNNLCSSPDLLLKCLHYDKICWRQSTNCNIFNSAETNPAMVLPNRRLYADVI